ncbi:low molecular weight protein-tyrosine-phosphatase [Paludibacterium paludis]|uniref:protein-tyrosine-phosphatase n=1 Tax=Paludibacterium paludis TaxID=1225769 RepID=A0A918P0V5_9NEIS|nr:low molecular weight protein-tyrosine-phosphatase [Paludibacterium paludis]GGY10980.1 phosphotyrosine protein phosphatase [Paludibacterium paludis]
MERWLFVCMGNICRSPTLEGVMRERIARAGLTGRLEVDSAGTGPWHAGKAPDERSARAAARRGYDLTPLRARQIVAGDFERFDLILAADRDNLAWLRERCPEIHLHKLRLALSVLEDGAEIPDPYFGGEDGFERVLDLVEAACDAWLAGRFHGDA